MVIQSQLSNKGQRLDDLAMVITKTYFLSIDFVSFHLTFCLAIYKSVFIKRFTVWLFWPFALFPLVNIIFILWTLPVLYSPRIIPIPSSMQAAL